MVNILTWLSWISSRMSCVILILVKIFLGIIDHILLRNILILRSSVYNNFLLLSRIDNLILFRNHIRIWIMELRSVLNKILILIFLEIHLELLIFSFESIRIYSLNFSWWLIKEKSFILELIILITIEWLLLREYFLGNFIHQWNFLHLESLNFIFLFWIMDQHSIIHIFVI